MRDLKTILEKAGLINAGKIDVVSPSESFGLGWFVREVQVGQMLLGQLVQGRAAEGQVAVAVQLKV